MIRRFTTPIEGDMRELHVGDELYITGQIFTARDEAHKKMLELGSDLPFMPATMPLFHCGPVVKRVNNEWMVVAAGPTTSARMESMEADFIEKFGVKIIIGKGGMGSRTLAALKKHGAIYASYTGGAGALAARSIRSVAAVYWLEELGVPEAVWVFNVRDFGPLLVSMDSHGASIYDSVASRVSKNLEQLMGAL